MVEFLGSAGRRPGASVHEWTDVRITVVDGAIVAYDTQFGAAFPDVGDDVSIGNGFKVRVSQLSYEHFGSERVGAGNLTIANGATFDQSVDGFTMSGRLLNNGSSTLNATTVVTGSIENNLSLTVKDYLMLQGVSTSTGNGFTLASQTGAPADLYLRGGSITGYTANPANGNAAIVDFSNNGRISGHGGIGSGFGDAAYPSNGGYLAIRNTTLGTIDANVSGQRLEIHTQLSPINPIRNDGLMQASNGGTLEVSASYSENGLSKSYLTQSSTGVIRANTGSTVVLEGTQLNGGKLDSVGTGIIRMDGFNPKISNVEITATATLDIGRATIFSGSIVNRGKVTNSQFDPEYVIAAEDVTLTGGGTFRLVDGYYEANVSGAAAGSVLTNMDNTITGVGALSGGNLTLINKGVVRADKDTVYSTTDEDVLALDALAKVVNSGTLEARSGAKLDIKSLGAVLENAGGTIQATGTGSKVAIYRTEVAGGTLKGVSGGVIDLREGRLNGVTLEGATVVGETTVKGQIVNKGVMTGGNLFITPTDATLSGGGTFRMLGGYFGTSIIGTATGSLLTNLDHTIIGVGGISGDALSVVNQGRIVADKDAYRTDDVDTLTIDSLAALTNKGTIQAQAGATLKVQNLRTSLNNADGTIQATGTGSKVAIYRTEVVGGTLKGVSGGVIDLREGRLNGVTLEGATVVGETTVRGQIVNKGVMTGGNLFITPTDATLSGGGTVRMQGASIVGTATGSLLTNLDNTIIGAGGIYGRNLSVVNQGRIVADIDTFALDSLAALTNKGTLQAQAGAVLEIKSVGTGAILNAGGTIQAIGVGSKVKISTTIKGGTVSAGTGATVELISGGGFDGVANQVTLSGSIQAVRAEASLKGAIANKGIFTLTDSAVTIGASTYLSGGGSVQLVGASTLGAATAGLVLVNLDNTIHGSGSLGRSSGLAFSNGTDGRVVADVANSSLVIETGRTVSNAGVLAAQGGTLNIRDKVTGTGHIEITGGGTAIVDQGVDHDVTFVGTSADTLHLSSRTPTAGGKGFDFDISGMGVGDRIKTDVGAGVGQQVDFTYTDTTGTGGTLTSAAYVGADGKAQSIKLSGVYSEGQFDLVGGADGALGYVRVKTKDGTAGSDTMKAVSAGERLIGLDGDDTLSGGAGTDVLDGSRGIDTASYAGATVAVTVSLETKAAQTIGGNMGSDRLISIENLTGSNYADTLTGNSVANILTGGGGDDTLNAKLGADIIVGGRGADDLYAGVDGNTDTFVFVAGDSGVTATTMDQIFNFRIDTNTVAGQRSAGADLIDLRGIDGDAGVAGDQTLRFVDQFSTATGTQPDGQVMVVSSGAGASGKATVLIDTNGDSKFDMSFEVMGVTKLSADDFLL